MGKLLLVLLFTITAYSSTLTQAQRDACNAAFKFGSDYDLGNTLAGIAWHESRCGTHKIGPTGDYGITQIHLGSLIKELGITNTHMNRSKLATQLVTDDQFAFALAIEELLYWKLKRGRNYWPAMVESYNKGTNFENHSYARKIAEAIQFLKKEGVLDERN